MPESEQPQKMFQNSSFPNGMARGHAVALWMGHYLKELHGAGMIEGGMVSTSGGEEIFKELEKTGFRPTQEEIESFMAYLVVEHGLLAKLPPL